MFNQLFVFLIFALSFTTLGAQEYHSAHAIVVSNYYGDNYVLLGKMKGSNKLSTFGGRRDPGEHNPKVTCAREVEEEALSVLGDQAHVLILLQNAHQVTGFKNGHISYVLPATFFGHRIPQKFRNERFNSKNLTYCQKEMIDIVAIRVDRLREKFLKGESLLFPDNQGVLRPLRESTKGAIQAALDSGKL
jgi:hypothetical protein